MSPWPAYSDNFPSVEVQGVTGDGLELIVHTDEGLPNDLASLAGSQAPKLMLFNRETSRWVRLDVASVTDTSPGSNGGRIFAIALTSVPAMYDENGDPRGAQIFDRLSPYTDRADVTAQALEAYFDGLGPGELVSAQDSRYARAARFPKPAQSRPFRAGQAMIGYLIEALGGTAGDAELTSISRNDPDLPINLSDGPNMITLGHVSIFPL